MAAEKITIDKLNRIYDAAETADREVFAEMRSNVLLTAGEHYSRKGQRYAQERIRQNQSLTEGQKLRLTKNHIHKIVRRYVANIATYAPGVTVLPQREGELQDQKSAELNKSVWEDAKTRYRLAEQKRKWLRSFVEIGECCVKIFWDPNQGEFLGFQPKVDEATGETLVDEAGQPVADEDAPVMSGALVYEQVFGMNLLRHASARDMRQAECWIVRKMADVEALKAQYAGDKDKTKMIVDSSKADFIVFDSDKTAYEKAEGQCLVREFYWPKSSEYPYGYFAITTSEGILEEGPLPGGLFPLVWVGFDEFATTARGRSIIKVARPFQAEINRASSAVATHQITIGDDKVLYQAGTKLQPGALLPGVRGIAYAGAPPTILPGRDGSQYGPYVDAQIAQLYDAVALAEENEEKGAQVDPYAMLFRKLDQQKKYAEYGSKFEQFLVDGCQLTLERAKIHYPDEFVVTATGKKERVNMAEFRATSPLSYAVKIEPRDETLETQFGKQLTFNHILQYASSSLSKEDTGRIMKAMPFANNDKAFSKLTIDDDCLDNDMLALERGEMPPFGKYDNHEFAVKVLSKRTREGDFRFLPPRVQQAYQARIQMHEQVMAQQAKALQDAKNEFIPSNGAMIATDMYVENPQGAEKPAKRVRIPYQALDWLVKKLETQGQGLEQLENQNQGVIAELASQITSGRAPPLPAPQNQGSAFQNGPGQGLGVSG